MEGKTESPRSGETTNGIDNIASALARVRTTYDPTSDHQQESPYEGPSRQLVFFVGPTDPLDRAPFQPPHNLADLRQLTEYRIVLIVRPDHGFGVHRFERLLQ